MDIWILIIICYNSHVYYHYMQSRLLSAILLIDILLAKFKYVQFFIAQLYEVI